MARRPSRPMTVTIVSGVILLAIVVWLVVELAANTTYTDDAVDVRRLPSPASERAR